jgi:hypothetical protein
MKHFSELDFALNRTERKRRRQALIAVLGLLFGLQVGAAAWRWQSLVDERVALAGQQRQSEQQGVRNNKATLNAEQIKLANSAQVMLDSIGVPWNGVLTAIETARTPRILVESIQPHAQDGTLSISVSGPDFAAVDAFVQGLMQQEQLYGVKLVSEVLSENMGNGQALRALISANWRSKP